ncbi:MAG: M23 family metallopeptidase [Pseudomonadota bacterium]
MIKHWAILAVSTLALAACDVVRVPGDGRAAPEPVPDGAPGPAPPVVPVDDPWGENETEEPTNIPVSNTEDTGPTEPTETDDPVEPEAPVDDPVIVSPPPPPPPPPPVKFEYFAPGDLIGGTGIGRVDDTVYAPNIVFPIKTAPTFPQSMVYRLGGAVGGDQCDPANYDIPWRDNFCETRSSTRNTPMCPTNKVHQGQDIRVGSAADCNALRRQAKVDRGIHEVVAVEDGIIQHIGTYSVQLKGTETGNIYSYLHLNMRRLRVSALDTVSEGDTLGFVSNDFGSTPTTFHLHFEIKAPIEGEGIVHVPPYMSLVAAYERREEGIGEVVEDDTVEVASAPVIVDPSKLIE